jgi:biopolymer transport protein ExbD
MEFEGRKRVRGEINLVPLINIVFLLLVFFMLSSTLVTPDRFDVALPESARARAAESQPIVVLIDGAGGVAVNNRPVSLGELEPALARLVEAGPQAELLVKADAAATTADVVNVLRRARAAGLERVALATRRRP